MSGCRTCIIRRFVVKRPISYSCIAFPLATLSHLSQLSSLWQQHRFSPYRADGPKSTNQLEALVTFHIGSNNFVFEKEISTVQYNKIDKHNFVLQQFGKAHVRYFACKSLREVFSVLNLIICTTINCIQSSNCADIGFLACVYLLS